MNFAVVSKAFLGLYIALGLNEWILCLNETSPADGSTKVDLKKLKVLTKDPDDDTKLKSLGSSDYEVKEESGETTITFKNDYKPTNVKIKGEEVWTHDPSKNGGKKPNSITYNTDKTKVVIDFDGLEITCEKDSDGNWSSTEKTKPNEGKKENAEGKKSKKNEKKAKESKDGNDSTTKTKKTPGEEKESSKASE